ncbi:unnamed protein product [Candida verbasci]|uniref:Uncharacterized protein n=1 Tax=Candida verbasci TaxID=1227364 RepID=A0A9W4TZZ0_9ASCO|nr:unnamed protein product [Candida verbasci]
MEELLSNLSNLDLNKSKQLGDFLRDEENRSSKLLQNNLHNLLIQFNLLLTTDKETINETLRVLINLLAFNEYNRSFITDLNSLDVLQFWNIIKAILPNYSERIFILLNQFIYNTELKLEYLSKLNHIRIQDAIYKCVNIDNIDDIGEFLTELLSHNELQNLDYKFLKNCVDLITNNEESSIVELIQLNKPDDDLFEKILLKIQTVEIPIIKRKLFSTAPLLANTEAPPIKYLSSFDPYIFSCCCITVGNFIIDNFTKCTIIKQLNIDKFMNHYWNLKITDIVQIQSIHIWKKLMIEGYENQLIKEMAQLISSKYASQLINLTKLINDNKPYYQEIYNLYLKFLRKLFEFSEPPIGIFEIINDSEITYICLKQRKYIHDHELFTHFITESVKEVDTVNFNKQVVALSMFTCHINNIDDELINNFIIPLNSLLLEFVKQRDMVKDEDKTNPEVIGFLHNIKFLAANTCQLINEFEKGKHKDKKFNELKELCKSIISHPSGGYDLVD